MRPVELLNTRSKLYAVFDAVGVRVRELPLNRKRLLDALAASRVGRCPAREV